MSVLLTVGHGRLDRAGLGRVLAEAGVAQLVDVRRFPASRHNPDVSRDSLTSWLSEAGLGYRWDERLGGRRRAEPATPDTWWRVEQFRGYAAWTRAPEFTAGMADLLADAARSTTSVMCSESVWWRCHRRLIADVAVLLHDVEVRHVMHDGRLATHEPAAGARLADDGQGVVWDGARPDSWR